jgi:hypothetical protein
MEIPFRPRLPEDVESTVSVGVTAAARINLATISRRSVEHTAVVAVLVVSLLFVEAGCRLSGAEELLSAPLFSLERPPLRIPSI